MTNAEIRSLADRHPSQMSMSRELGCSREWARRLCNRAGITRFRKGGYRVIVEREMVQTMWARGLSAPEIADLFGMRLNRVVGIVQYWRDKGMRFDRRQRVRESGP